MTQTRGDAGSTAPARIEYLKVRNFRALRDVEFKDTVDRFLEEFERLLDDASEGGGY